MKTLLAGLAGCAALTLAAFAAPALAQDQPPAPTADADGAANAGATPIAGDGVYKAFHEKAGIQRIMDDFIPRVTSDPRIQAKFAGTNLDRLKLLLVQQVCYLTGGPCVYTGRSMKEAHASMHLDNGDFNALAEDLQISMDREKVPFTAQNKLLAKLAPMQRTIVTRK